MIPKIPLSIIMPLAGLVALLAAGWYISSLQGNITALRASEAVLRESITSISATAQHNADMYLKLDVRYKNQQLLINEYKDKAVEAAKEDIRLEKDTDAYIETLDKNSFERQCYDMVVNPSGLRQ